MESTGSGSIQKAHQAASARDKSSSKASTGIGKVASAAVLVDPPTKPGKKRLKVDDEGGDEFDNIFGSLETSKSKDSKSLKKKKRKKADEFDDIFGGL